MHTTLAGDPSLHLRELKVVRKGRLKEEEDEEENGKKLFPPSSCTKEKERRNLPFVWLEGRRREGKN